MKTARKHAQTASMGFTLIELLTAVFIIAILAGLLIAGMSKARKRAKRLAGFAEVSTIRTAWQQYLSDYGAMPTNWIAGADLPDVKDETAEIRLEGEFAEILVGLRENADNPNNVRYMDFKHLDENGDPVSPWGTPYYVKMDYDFDDVINAGNGPLTNDFRGTVLVWTYETYGSTNDTSSIIGSWQF